MRQWAAYRNKHGSLNAGERIERAVAQLTAIYANRYRKEGHEPLTLWDLMPHAERPAESLEQAMATWH
ncbi:phage tail assembly protein T [Salinicola rhizosphaerae]|uniref:Minor tail T domain-containing protein n=1 Tax=Salinicola rhizosphaerae TaxID=1443141 RepID=A0ABQ3E963_9GAMM|nr:hypothetical protein [Salinicola rhizosphaerae]GHB30449.1 hypothetical protein GCM10009038_31540 [Salinicola rhizosphaerae]